MEYYIRLRCYKPSGVMKCDLVWPGTPSPYNLINPLILSQYWVKMLWPEADCCVLSVLCGRRWSGPGQTTDPPHTQVTANKNDEPGPATPSAAQPRVKSTARTERGRRVRIGITTSKHRHCQRIVKLRLTPWESRLWDQNSGAIRGGAAPIHNIKVTGRKC